MALAHRVLLIDLERETARKRPQKNKEVAQQLRKEKKITAALFPCGFTLANRSFHIGRHVSA
jgi:hypothetical protein